MLLNTLPLDVNCAYLHIKNVSILKMMYVTIMQDLKDTQGY